MKSKKILALAILLMFLHVRTLAQNVGINDDGSQPDNSAMLHIKSANKGLLIPQIALTGVNDVTSIPSPATSLLVYNTTIGSGLTAGYYYNSGTPTAPVWTALTTTSGLNNFTESNYLYNTKYGVKLLARSDAQTNVDFVISPKGNGAIIGQQPDGTITGGNIRGQKAVDLQMARGLATQVASGSYSFTVGASNTASHFFSTAIGSSNTASGQTSIAVGANNTASGTYATAIGYGNTTSGPSSFTVGASNIASGDYSFASGYNNTAQSYGESVLGFFATIGSGNIDSFVATDRLFVIGNGTSLVKSDAFSILKNGNTNIGGSLTINGNGTGTSLTLPATRGTSGNVLTTDGIGGTSWTATTGGTVTDVTGTAPISSSGGNAPAISISAATTSAAGSMIAADKTKLDGIAANANNYVHPTGDGNLHVPVTSTTNNGKVLTAGATAGSLSWSSLPTAPVTSVAGKTGVVTLVNSDVGLGNVENTALSTWAGSSSITTLGTIAAGTWNGTTLSLAKGGTGATTKTAAFDALSPMTAAGDIVYGGASGTGTRLPKGTAGQVLTMNSGATAPQWSTPTTGTVTGVTGTAPIVSSGGAAPVISISASTTSVAGSMSATDKTKLDAITGTNTGDQIITLTGDVAGSGTGSFPAIISASSVTNPKMANMAANTIKVNSTAAAAAPTDLALNANTFPSRKSTGNITANSITDFAFDILNDDNAATVRTTIGAGTGNGTVTSVTGTAPISVTTGTITPAISISAATISAAGSMSAADKTKLDGSTHAIGDSYGGGIVFYVYDGGRHGLIAATTDQSNDIRWYGGTNTNTRARADGIGAGLKNTAIIIANQGPVDGNAFAATLCNEYSVTVNGVTYGDWYLPSKYELNLLYLQKDLVGNFTTGTYWSSTEFSATQVWVHVFFNGEQYEGGKSNIISTRAIRAF